MSKADMVVADPKTQSQELFSFQLIGTITDKDLVGVRGDPVRTAFEVGFFFFFSREQASI